MPLPPPLPRLPTEAGGFKGYQVFGRRRKRKREGVR
jgi:hypothetical protein